MRARVFEPFFTTKGERGTGLGLPRVFGIVERHGGSIALASEPGWGATFTLSLRAAPETPARAEPAGEAVAAARPLRVLAVDDEPRLARMVALMLRPAGHSVATACSVEEALARLAEQPFDVVLSDLGLGDGPNGWDLAACVRERWPGTRVVLATGWGAAIDPAEAHARGIDAVLSKPYHPDDLLGVVTARRMP